MSFTPKQRRYLRSLAHHRKPVVIIGHSGLTPAVMREIDQCLSQHELIKIKINSESKTKRKEIAESICRQTGSERVQDIGHMTTVYRAGTEPEISLP